MEGLGLLILKDTNQIASIAKYFIISVRVESQLCWRSQRWMSLLFGEAYTKQQRRFSNKWCGGLVMVLPQCAMGVVLDTLWGLKIRFFWKPTQGWHLELLHRLMSTNIISLLLQRNLHHPLDGRDIPNWSSAKSGTFSIASLCHLWLLDHTTWCYAHRNRIWKFKGPLRASLTLWIVLYGALPTTELLWKRDIIVSLLCQRYKQRIKSSLHILRDCPSTKMVWRHVFSSEEWATFIRSNEVLNWDYL